MANLAEGIAAVKLRPTASTKRKSRQDYEDPPKANTLHRSPPPPASEERVSFPKPRVPEQREEAAQATPRVPKIPPARQRPPPPIPNMASDEGSSMGPSDSLPRHPLRKMSTDVVIPPPRQRNLPPVPGNTPQERERRNGNMNGGIKSPPNTLPRQLPQPPSIDNSTENENTTRTLKPLLKTKRQNPNYLLNLNYHPGRGKKSLP